MPALRFWGAAVLAALAFAGLSALLFPYEWLGIATAEERWRTWLLTLWTSGVLGILFGLSSLLGTLRWIGVRDVHEAGSVKAALERRRSSGTSEGTGGLHGNFAVWVVCTGGLLVLLYFVAWWLGN